MKTYITIDGGTTNTRVSLVRGREILDTEKISAGARASMEGSVSLADAIGEAVSGILAGHSLADGDIDAYLASGMITSEFGLCPLPHLTAPVGLPELHAGMSERLIPEISPRPVIFMRGVKVVDGDPLRCDMMRGEETELYGIGEGVLKNSVYVLPGSHSKIIYVDGEGRISHFSTTLTGEMIASLSGHTILRDAVDLSSTALNTEYLSRGFEYARERGINEALFKTRVLKNLGGLGSVETYSYFLGVVLSAEIVTIISSNAEKIIVGGKKQIKEATLALLRRYSDKTVVPVSDSEVDASTSLGMIRIYEYSKM